jgi:serine/threonine protein kinase/Flp pilus assembly protein TadD
MTRLAGPLDEPTTRVVGSITDSDAMTVAIPLKNEPEDADSMTVALDPDHAMTIAAVSDSLADAMTMATPAASTVRKPASPRRPRRSADDTGPLEIGQSFGPRYHIIRLLGLGGMGAVYQAWDAELGVAVAIKVIRPEVMDDPVTAEEVSRRFKRELLLARQVTHKNVVRIHDIGDIDGIKYITMSYVEGTDLATILKREGKQPVRDVLRIARAVISGLVAAHSAGVVHRDLKPANIMIGGDGEALIMDFGIAHSTGDATAPAPGAGLAIPENLRRAASQSAATTVGSIVGTLEYMAPEQAKAQPIDQRADVYAYGLILYDILLGRRRASSGQSAVEELQRRMTSPPPPLQALDKTIPPAVVAIVSRCVEPEAEKRFPTSAAVAAELDKLDEEGKVIPIARRLTKRALAAAIVLVLALLGGTAYLTRQAVAPAAVHEPVSVVIADLENRTKDPDFDGTLEPALRRAIQGASFISGFDRSAVASVFGFKGRFDEKAAIELAANQGLGVVLSGFVASDGKGYTIGLKAIRPLNGQTITEEEDDADTKEQVLEVATRLIARVRTALGDDTSESEQMFAMRTVSATSLEVMRHYAAAIDAVTNGKRDEAEASFKEALKADPKFGYGYLGLAALSRNRGRQSEAVEQTNQALKLIETMTERESFNATAFYARITGDYQQCVMEYGNLVTRYAGDVLARNQRGLCLSKTRDMQAAVDEMQQVVKMLPKRTLFRSNLAVYHAYAGQWEQAVQEAQAVEEPYDLATLSIAFARLGQGRLPEAETVYRQLAGMGTRGKSWSAAGFGDLALYEGRFDEAIRILEEGAAEDLKGDAPSPERAARKLISSAYAHLSAGRKQHATDTVERALMLSSGVDARFLGARVLVDAGAIKRAQELAASLSKEAPTEPRAYGKILEGQIALAAGKADQAVTLLNEANGILDTWFAHFDLGLAYLKLGAARLPAAHAEFERCLKRQGEALSLIVDEIPTYGYFPVVYYYQGLVREGLKSEGAEESFNRYLAIRGGSTEDPLLREVRKRVN